MIKKLDVVAAIIERDDKILLAQRPGHADQAGLWEFAGGKAGVYGFTRRQTNGFVLMAFSSRWHWSTTPSTFITAPSE